jgi:branched-chain amino acid transport system substrate-binding protein
MASLLAAGIGLALGGGAALADPGVGADKIVFGQAAALEGPAAALGSGMRDGILAAFAEANKAGGVNGRKLELLSVDDGYDPNKSIEATKKLLNDDKVFALIGPVGTPTSSATQPIATENGVPFIGPFTGAEFLRNPSSPTSSTSVLPISRKRRKWSSGSPRTAGSRISPFFIRMTATAGRVLPARRRRWRSVA